MSTTTPPTPRPVPTPAARAPGRITDADALAMYHDLSLHELGRLGYQRLQMLHPEPYRTYVVDRNINYANVCTAKCIFCNFKADPGDDDAYILSFEQIGKKIEELIDIGGTQVLMQGGLVPDQHDPTGDGLPFDWYLDLLRFIKKNYPTIHIHAFSPPEIWAFHQVFHMPLKDVLLRLQEAGLDTIPGGGGEILVDRVRRKIGQGKTLSHEWLEVMRAAHQVGMHTSCTMMMGHIETIEERIEHLRVLRDLQDETGGFTAFIHWPFQPEGTPLGRWKTRDLPTSPPDPLTGTGATPTPRATPTLGATPTRGATPQPGATPTRSARPGATPTRSARRASESVADDAILGDAPSRTRPGYLPDGQHLHLADAADYLRMLALARVYLDNIPNIQSSWVTMGPKVGQLALFYGANDMGSVMMEENVVSQAGSTFSLNESEIRRLIREAGWDPQQRDQYYRPIDTPRPRRPLPVV